jgi:uncharacterized protein (DUF433 family)
MSNDHSAAIEAALHVMYGDHPHAENYRAHVQVGVTAAAEVIEADVRRKIAEELGAYVWAAPGRLGGKPCIGGHRLDVVTIARHVWADGVDSVQIPWPYLTRAEILTACWYLGCYGAPNWRERWGSWTDQHEDAMWSGRWDEVPDPPTADIARGDSGGRA